MGTVRSKVYMNIEANLAIARASVNNMPGGDRVVDVLRLLVEAIEMLKDDVEEEFNRSLRRKL